MSLHCRCLIVVEPSPIRTVGCGLVHAVIFLLYRNFIYATCSFRYKISNHSHVTPAFDWRDFPVHNYLKAKHLCVSFLIFNYESPCLYEKRRNKKYRLVHVTTKLSGGLDTYVNVDKLFNVNHRLHFDLQYHEYLEKYQLPLPAFGKSQGYLWFLWVHLRRNYHCRSDLWKDQKWI